MTRDLARLLDRKLFQARSRPRFRAAVVAKFRRADDGRVRGAGAAHRRSRRHAVVGAAFRSCCRRRRRRRGRCTDLAAALAGQKRGLAASRSAFRASPSSADRLEGSPRRAPGLRARANRCGRSTWPAWRVRSMPSRSAGRARTGWRATPTRCATGSASRSSSRSSSTAPTGATRSPAA